jgi:hemerythrin-like domain-containing protein
MVMPIGPLMTEHRLIERMIASMKKELTRIKREGKANSKFIATAVDFIRTYADRLHHGKEEDILFRALESKDLEGPHRKTMEELIEEHRWGRKKVKELVDANIKYSEGDEERLEVITECLQELVRFYPRHIEKEDKHFFIPVMNYFDQAEQESILEEEAEFDRDFIHELYKAKVKEIENSSESLE